MSRLSEIWATDPRSNERGREKTYLARGKVDFFDEGESWRIPMVPGLRTHGIASGQGFLLTSLPDRLESSRLH